MAKPSVTLRNTKGSPLTTSELDTNFTNLQNATVSLQAGTGGTTVSSDLNGTITLVAGSGVSLTGDNTAKTLTINAPGAGGLGEVVQDTSPQLGGDLDVNGFKITSASNGSIEIQPNGSGIIQLSGPLRTTDRVVSIATSSTGSDDGLDRGLEWTWQTNNISRTAKTVTAFTTNSTYYPITYDYSLKKVGRASIRMDGYYQSLYPASSTDFAFGTGDYTIEFWFYKTGIAGGYPQHLMSYSSGDYDLRFSAANTLILRQVLGGPTTLITYSSVSNNTWYHVAITRSGTSLRMFINGTQVGTTVTNSFNLANNSIRFVDDGSNPPSAGSLFMGYLDEIRIQKGTAQYTSNFTPSTEPLQNTANTKLLLHLDGDVVDDAGTTYTEKKGALVWDNSTEKLTYYSDATNTAEVISGTLGTIKADGFEGAFYGDHYGDLTGVARYTRGLATLRDSSLYSASPSGQIYYDTFDQRVKVSLNEAWHSVITSTSGYIDIDANILDAGGTQASYANAATKDFANFSGMIIVNNTGSTGNVALWICGGGTAVKISDSVSNTSGTITSVGGINGYRWTNNTGATDTFSFVAIRTRTTG